MDKTVSPAHDTLCVLAVPWRCFLPCYWLSGMALLSQTSTAHFFLPLCSFNCSSPYFPLAFFLSLLVAYTMSTLAFFVSLLAIVWQKRERIWCLKKKKKIQNKPDPGKLGTREQRGFSTTVLPILLKSHNYFFSASLRFSLF